MQQIAIRLDTWSGQRFTTLLERSGWDAPRALGALTMLWAVTRAAKDGPNLPLSELRVALAPLGDDIDRVTDSLVAAGYVRCNAPGNYAVVDNEAHFALKRKLQDAGARGGYQKHRARSKKKAVALRRPKEPSDVSVTWATYKEAFRRRYQVDPVSNGTVMGQLSRLVSLVGQDAPKLAAFYVRHDNSFYIRCQHSVGVLLKDYSSLYTQFQRNVTVTEHDVQAHSRSGELEAQLRRFGAR